MASTERKRAGLIGWSRRAVALLLLASFFGFLTVSIAQPEGYPMAQETSRGATMDSSAKANAFHEVLRKMGAGEKVDPQLWNEFVAAQNDDVKTGPQVGEKVPDFTLPDQYGNQRSLRELSGPQGLLLVFTRSADW